MTGPSPSNLFGTFCIVIVTSVIFNVLVVPDVADATHVIVLAIGIAWPLWCLINLLATGTSDPGIVKRQPKPPPTLDGRVRPRYKSVMLPGTGGVPSISGVNNSGNNTSDEKQVTVKWNDTINSYQPPRAHHCSANDDCVDKFDHHCPWVGTTIGRRNYRTFIFFVFGTTILCVYVIGICAYQIKLKYDERSSGTRRVLNAIGDAPAAFVILVLAFLGFWFVAILSGFHSYLIITNQTTYENFRDGYTWAENPYNKGVVGNCWEVFCLPTQKSRFAFTKSASQQPPDLEAEAEAEAEWRKREKRRAEREERRRKEAQEASSVGEGDVELGEVDTGTKKSKTKITKKETDKKKDSNTISKAASSSSGAGGVMKALATGKASLDDVKVVVDEESGYEGDRDRTPKARDEKE